MTELVGQSKSMFAKCLDIGWEFASLFFLCCGAFGIIYGDYAAIPKLTTVGMVSLILATLCEVKSLGKRIP